MAAPQLFMDMVMGPVKSCHFTADAEFGDCVFHFCLKADRAGCGGDCHQGHFAEFLRHLKWIDAAKYRCDRSVDQKLDHIADQEHSQEFSHRNDHCKSCGSGYVCQQAEDTDRGQCT